MHVTAKVSSLTPTDACRKNEQQNQMKKIKFKRNYECQDKVANDEFCECVLMLCYRQCWTEADWRNQHTIPWQPAHILNDTPNVKKVETLFICSSHHWFKVRHCICPYCSQVKSSIIVAIIIMMIFALRHLYTHPMALSETNNMQYSLKPFYRYILKYSPMRPKAHAHMHTDTQTQRAAETAARKMLRKMCQTKAQG